jgi:hypothetical protein
MAEFLGTHRIDAVDYDAATRGLFLVARKTIGAGRSLKPALPGSTLGFFPNQFANKH